jgi:hypothetical protein
MTEYTLMLHKLAGLQTELADLAFVLERQGRVDAADVAVTTSARIGELWEELVSTAGQTAGSGSPAT